MVEKLGKYVLEELVAVGGMAEIYRAHTVGLSGLEKVLAVKRLHEQYVNDRDFIDMLVDEARITIQLNHKNICQVFDLENIDGHYFLTMEYIDGRDLARVIRRFTDRGEAMPLDMAVFVAAEICAGLSYAHRKMDAKGQPMGIIHRDMSPQNVLVSFEGEVKIVDFGIAKATSSSSMTQSGVIKGKFYYMAPEQARGDRIDQRADIWAIGAILYEMLTGHMLYQGEEDASLVGRVRRAEFIPIRHLAPDIPELLEAIVNKALARDLRMRFKDALEMHMALATALHQLASPYNTMLLSQHMHELFDTGADVTSGAFDVVDPRMSRVDYRPSDESSVIYRLNTEEIEFLQSDDSDIVGVSPQTTLPGMGARLPGGSTNTDWRPGDPVASSDNEDASTLLFNKGQMSKLISEAAEIERDQFGDLPADPLPAMQAPRLKRAARPQLPRPSGLEVMGGGVGNTVTESTAISAAPNPWNDGWSLELIHDPARGQPLVGLFVVALLGILLFAGAFIIGSERWLLSEDAEAAGPTDPSSGFEIRSHPPGALVYVNGDNTGKRTPLLLTDVDDEGARNIKLELAHHERFEDTVSVEPGGSTLLELVPLTGRLVVVTRPPQAKVFVDGKSHGRSPVTVDDVIMRDTHQIAVSHDGYQSAMKSITWDLTDGDNKTVEIVLEPTFEAIVSDLEAAAIQSVVGLYPPLKESDKPIKKKLSTRKPSGYLFINSKPPGKIFVDGKDIGRSTPVAKLKVEAGNHKVKVYFPSSKTYSKVKNVQVRPGKSVKMLITN